MLSRRGRTERRDKEDSQPWPLWESLDQEIGGPEAISLTVRRDQVHGL